MASVLLAASAGAVPVGLAEGVAPFAVTRGEEVLTVRGSQPQTIESGDMVSTTKEGARVSLLDGSSVVLSRNSSASFGEGSRTTLHQGSVITALNDSAPFTCEGLELTAPADATATAAVRRTGEGSVEMACLSGGPIAVVDSTTLQQVGTVSKGDLFLMTRREDGSWLVSSPKVLQQQEGIDDPTADEENNEEAGGLLFFGGGGGGTTAAIIGGVVVVGGGVAVAASPELRDELGIDDDNNNNNRPPASDIGGNDF